VPKPAGYWSPLNIFATAPNNYGKQKKDWITEIEQTQTVRVLRSHRQIKQIYSYRQKKDNKVNQVTKKDMAVI
jgi:hypothetical protein